MIGSWLIVALAAQAHALDFGVRQTVGSDGYSGTKLYAVIGDAVYVRPGLSLYRSDLTTGTFKTISLAVGYDAERFTVAANAGGTPETNGYSSRYLGLEGTLIFLPEEGWLERFEPGVGITGTSHRDDLQLAPANSGQRQQRVQNRPDALVLGQTDLDASLDLRVLGHELGAAMTRSFYDKDLQTAAARASQVAALSGVFATIQGFPENSFFAFWERRFGAVTPMLSYSYTTYKIAQPATHAPSAGFRAKLGRWGARLSYQRVLQRNEPDRNYYEAGLSVGI